MAMAMAMGWVGWDGVGCDRFRWDRLGKDQMGRNGMKWGGMGGVLLDGMGRKAPQALQPEPRPRKLRRGASPVGYQ